MNNKLNVMIIGCGNIAGGYDMKLPQNLIRTHAGAYKASGKFNLLACVDSNPSALSEFQNYWNIEYSASNIEDLKFLIGKIDVISICTPSEIHYEIFNACIPFKPKMFFCEKPLSTSLNDSIDMVNFCKRKGILLCVNYTRRWDPSVIELQKELSNSTLGKIRSIVGHYNKGLFNNGGHMIHLLDYLFGPLNIVKVGRVIHDFFEQDPSIEVLMNSGNGDPIFLGLGHAGDYSFFELQIITENGVIVMENGGLQWRRRFVKVSENFDGYKALGQDVLSEGGYLQALPSAVENIYSAVNSGVALACSGDDAVRVQKICNEIKNERPKNGFH